MSSLFTIGSDIEFPLWDTEQNKYVSAIPYLKGTKHAPEILENGSLLQWDNVALEFAVPPTDNENDFVQSISDTFELAKQKIPHHFKIMCMPSAIFDQSELNCKEAMEAGCDPDFNAWNAGRPNEIDQTALKSGLRTFGAHVHIGSTIHDTSWLQVSNEALNFVKFLDITLGFVSAFLDNIKESKQRKKLYGKAGCYRTPPHGVEYRTLSNFWVKTPESVRMIYNLVYDAVHYYNQFDTATILSHIGYSNITMAINGNYSVFTKEWVESLHHYKIISDKSWELIQVVENQNKQSLIDIDETWLRKAA